MNQRKKEDLAAIQHLFGLATPEQAEACDAFMKTIFPPREDPKDERIRELEAENADLKRQLRDALERC
jgi:hypothetical protein